MYATRPELERCKNVIVSVERLEKDTCNGCTLSQKHTNDFTILPAKRGAHVSYQICLDEVAIDDKVARVHVNRMLRSGKVALCLSFVLVSKILIVL